MDISRDSKKQDGGVPWRTSPSPSTTSLVATIFRNLCPEILGPSWQKWHKSHTKSHDKHICDRRLQLRREFACHARFPPTAAAKYFMPLLYTEVSSTACLTRAQFDATTNYDLDWSKEPSRLTLSSRKIAVHHNWTLWNKALSQSAKRSALKRTSFTTRKLLNGDFDHLD